MRIEKVLLVDDDAGIRKVAEISLSRIGKWKALAVDSGIKALEIIPSFDPDVILLDVMMPILDGPKTFRVLCERQCKIPVIFLTAKVLKQEILSYVEMGAAGVICKPFDPLFLPAEITAILLNHYEKARVA